MTVTSPACLAPLTDSIFHSVTRSRHVGRPQAAIDSLYDRYQNVYGQPSDVLQENP